VGLSDGQLAKLVLVLIEFVNNSVMATTFHRSPCQRALATCREVDVDVGLWPNGYMAAANEFPAASHVRVHLQLRLN